MKQEDFTKIKKILQWVWESKYSSFYREKYKKAGIKSWKEIKTFRDFQNLPFLTRDDFIEIDPFQRLYLPLSKAESIATTSGTTNKNIPLIMLKERRLKKELLATLKYQFNAISRYKIKRMLYLNGPSAVNRVYQNAKAFEKRCLIIGDITNLPITALVASKIRIDAIESSPTAFAVFIPYLQKVYDLKKVRVIVLSSEYCSITRLKVFQKYFPNARFSFYVAASEANAWGYQCEKLENRDPNFFHWLPFNLPEIIDPETNKSTSLYEQGELVLTTPFQTIFPLIRYKTGDMTTFKKRGCECKNSHPLFESLGRANFESLKIQGATLHIKMIEAALFRVNRFIKEDYKLHAYEEVVNGTIAVRLVAELMKRDESLDENTIKPIIIKLISQNLYLSGRMTLDNLVEKGLFLPLEIRFVETLPFEVKRRRIISHIK